MAPSESDKIYKADSFIKIFDELLEEAREQLDGNQIFELTQRAFLSARNMRKFKLEIIREHIVGKVKIELPPTFINHMVNEVEEYLKILRCLLTEGLPSAHPLHYHNLWLPDASGHAGAIYCGLDSVEKDLRKESKMFVKYFDALYKKADELSGYLRTMVKGFPALDRLNSQAELKIIMFMKFLKEIEEMRLTKKALGTIAPLMTDHMYREECYYLTKLSLASEVSKPDCDPAEPRI